MILPGGGAPSACDQSSQPGPKAVYRIGLDSRLQMGYDWSVIDVDLCPHWIPAVMELQKMPEPRVTIKIPRPLYERIAASIEGQGFSSVTDFIVFVLRDLMMTEGVKGKKTGDEELSRDELEAIRERLKSLGYL